ncbi:MAG: serine/threonine-protein kinase [Planctomycetota bacterium]
MDPDESDIPPLPELHYGVQGLIAEGGMGKIYRAWDPVLERPLAMKVLKAGRSSSSAGRNIASAGLVRRFVDEARITGKLDHPGVVPIHALDIDEDGHHFFTMQLVEGMTFQEVIKKARDEREGWNLTRAIHSLQRACATVAYAHSRGVLHRDLKPANIMVGAFGETYVMDRGLAKDMRS